MDPTSWDAPFWAIATGLFLIVMARANGTYWLGRLAARGARRTRIAHAMRSAAYERAVERVTRWGAPVVTVSFVTVGGAFAERFPAVLHVTRPDTARITLTLALDTLSGAFSVSPAPGVVTKAVVLDAELTAQGTSGTLRGQIEQTLGSVASARSFTYACWPAGNASCVGL
jgi:hypothetical protein